MNAYLLSVKVKEIQTCAQFYVNISMYFIDKIIQKKHWDQADDFKWASCYEIYSDLYIDDQ